MGNEEGPRSIGEAYAKPKADKTFHIGDASIHAWCPRTDNSREVIGGDWHTYNAVRRLMRRHGFTFHVDPEMRRQYDRIWRGYHVGRRGDVLFHAEIFPAGCRVQFHEDVVRDNSNGGRYTYDKMQKSPYLWRLRVTLAISRIAELLKKRGFVDRTAPKPKDAMDFVRIKRAEHDEFHAGRISSTPWYNSEDADKAPMKDGDRRCFRARNGRIMRGTVYHNINNMWWVVVDRYEVTNLAAFELFTYDPARHVRKEHPEPVLKMARALERAVKRTDFLRAAAIQGALNRVTTAHDFAPGDRVVVDHPNYRGPGIVDYVQRPFHVGVKLSNGNTWRYEWATVKPAPAAAQGATA